MNQFYYIQLRHAYGAGFTFLTKFFSERQSMKIHW